jgi:hypothetical protein
MRRPPDWVLGTSLAVAGVVVLAILVFVPGQLHPSLSNADLAGIEDAEQRITLQQAQARLQNDARTTLLQGLAGLVLVIGAVATWRQVQISRHGQITERLTRSVDQLASPSVDVRLGGLYALERVAKNSYEDRDTVTAILTAFIRTHAPAPDTTFEAVPAPRRVAESVRWLRVRSPDVQAALTIVGRRPAGRPEDDVGEYTHLYLSYTDLRRAWLNGGQWSGLICRNADLAGVRLRDAILDHADLADSDLREAHLGRARLVGASLKRVRLDGANLHGADLRGADLTGATLDGAELTLVRADSRTRWPDGFDADRRLTSQM